MKDWLAKSISHKIFMITLFICLQTAAIVAAVQVFWEYRIQQQQLEAHFALAFDSKDHLIQWFLNLLLIQVIQAVMIALLVVYGFGKLIKQHLLQILNNLENLDFKVKPTPKQLNRIPLFTHGADELAALNEAVNKMSLDLYQKNHDLEQQIADRTYELRNRNRYFKNILKNIKQGIFTIVKGGAIHPEYSDYTLEIFKRSSLAEEKALSLLFDDSNLGSDEKARLNAIVVQMIGMESINFLINSQTLPRKITKTIAGEMRYLEIEWEPLVADDDLIEKVMVSVRDVTEEKSLKDQAEQQSQEMECLIEILNCGIKRFHLIVSNAFDIIAASEQLLNGEVSAGEMDHLLLNIHTIKGNLRLAGLRKATNVVHTAEALIDGIYKARQYNTAAAIKQLHQSLSQIKQVINQYLKLINRKLAFMQQKEFSNRKSKNEFMVINNIYTALQTIYDRERLSTGGMNTINAMLTHCKSLLFTSFIPIESHIQKAISENAMKLNKPIPELQMEEFPWLILYDLEEILKNIFTHMINNIMDHGIESPQERIAKGKPEKGLIKIGYGKGERIFFITIEDDGSGLNLDKLREKGLASHMISPAATDERVAELVFAPGVSTANSVTDISGRGVGMNAIRTFLRNLGGDIKLHFSSTTITTVDQKRQLCFEIELPEKYIATKSIQKKSA